MAETRTFIAIMGEKTGSLIKDTAMALLHKVRKDYVNKVFLGQNVQNSAREFILYVFNFKSYLY